MINERQKMFCEYYCGISKGNAVDAAIRAGYAENYSKKHAYNILKKPEINKYVCSITGSRTISNIATIEDIHAFWSSVMNDENARTADRLRAAELLAKCKGAFNNNDW